MDNDLTSLFTVSHLDMIKRASLDFFFIVLLSQSMVTCVTMFQGLKELTEALLSENSNGFKNNGNVDNLADARRRLVRYD